MLPVDVLDTRDTHTRLVRQGSCRDWVESRLGFRDQEMEFGEESEGELRALTLSKGVQRMTPNQFSALPLLPDTNKQQKKISQYTPPDHYTLKPLSSHQTQQTSTTGKSSNSRSILPSYEDIQARVLSSGSAPPLPVSPSDPTEPPSPFPPEMDGTKRKTTPDLLELSNMYEHIHNQTITRTQSSPGHTRPRSLLSNRPDLLPRPWSDTARVQVRPRQLEPLLNAPLASDRHIRIAQQKGLTGLHLSCNYSPGQWRAALDPLVSETGQSMLETHREDDSEGDRDRSRGKHVGQ